MENVLNILERMETLILENWWPEKAALANKALRVQNGKTEKVTEGPAALDDIAMSVSL